MYLLKLAVGNIKKYKLHYSLVLVVVIGLCVGLMSFLAIYENQYNYKKYTYQQSYGTYYACSENTSVDDLDQITRYAGDHELNYGIVTQQGNYKNQYRIVNADQNARSIAGLKLTEGKEATDTNEVLITDAFSKVSSYSVNDTIDLEVNGKVSRYTIVGIVSKKYESLSDIYTTIPWTKDNKVSVLSEGVLSESYPTVLIYDSSYKQTALSAFVESDAQYNNFEANANMAYLSEVYIYIIEVLVIGCFILIALINTSLKRRNQEFGLLRSIGMTSKQLFIMVFLENILLVLTGVLISFVTSIPIAKAYLAYKLKDLNGYTIAFNTQGRAVALIFLTVIIMVFIMWPVVTSSKQPLSGYFGEGNFKYFQVHYKKLQYLTKYRLASRELKSDKLSLALLIVTSFIAVYSGTYIYNGHVDSISYSTQDMMHSSNSKQYYDVYLTDDSLLEEVLQASDENVSISYVDESMNVNTHHLELNDLALKVYAIDQQYEYVEGQAPSSQNEAAITTGSSVSYLTDVEVPGGNLNKLLKDNSYTYKGQTFDKSKLSSQRVNGKSYLVIEMSLNIGDTVTIENETYTITGKTSNIALISNGVLVGEDTYQKLSSDHETTNIRMYYNNDTKSTLKDTLNKLVYNHQESISFTEVAGRFHGGGSSSGTVSFRDYVIDLKYVVVPVAFALLVCFLLNTNNMYNKIEDYAILQLLGMTKKEIWIKQLYKAIIQTIKTMLVFFGFIALLVIIYKAYYFPIIQICLVTLVIFIYYFIVYCIPILPVISGNLLDVLGGKE